MVTMQGPVPVVFTYKVTGTRYAVVMHGIEDIGGKAPRPPKGGVYKKTLSQIK
ncbi:hypothetical protein GCM10022210_44420 [Mucilaginibacter dorajii]|uniref:Uncharacterized protein n=1 Tax=Mucilaginibacter dorajii TaxID=692994 RepID=A0ABP7QRQ4_9SPHI